MPTLMTCPRHYTLRTTSGHVIRFEPDTPTMVPDAVVSEAMAVNILPVDDLPAAPAADGAPAKVNLGGPLRDALALRAIDELARANDPHDFDAGGRPKVATLNDRTGLSLSASERATYWDRYRTLKSAGEELPTHKALETVLEIQALSTPSGVAEYAAALDVSEDAIKGRPLREQKQLLLAAALKA